jgi:hypothetical protein
MTMFEIPSGKYPDGTGEGGLIVYLVFRNACTFDTSPPLEVTVIVIDFQFLPLPPVELDRSRVYMSQLPIEVGAKKETNGFADTRGGCSSTLTLAIKG